MKIQVKFVVLIYFGVVTKVAESQFCFEKPDEFSNICTTEYNGTATFGRCFFVPGPPYTNMTWANAWKKCAKYGATLAHLHTWVEADAVTTYLQKKFLAGNARIALVRDPDAVKGTYEYAMTFDTTRWYLNATYSPPIMTVRNTWIQNRQQDDKSFGSDGCFSLVRNFSIVADSPCNKTWAYALCTIYNEIQNFNLDPGVCGNTTSFKTYLSTSSPDECATHCANSVWCRSFNYYDNTKKCELFPWGYTAGLPAGTVVQNVTGCTRYFIWN